MCQRVSYKKKYFFFASLKSRRKESDPKSDPDPLARGTDPRIQIRIRTKMSRILNTGFLLAEPKSRTHNLKVLTKI